MSIANAAGRTYTGSQVSVGDIHVAAGGTTFTETANNNADTLKILSVSGSTVRFAYTSAATGKLDGFGTVLANTTYGFMFTYLDQGKTVNFFVTNWRQKDAVGNTAMMTNESSAPVYNAPCYCPGTLIRTEDGDVPVESLGVGDRVVTVGGEVEAIRWVGNRAYAGRFFRANPAVWPVRFRAGSLGTAPDGAPLPTRDLLVSPKHAMLIDGVLVPAELLVNGATIVRDGGAGAVSYIHLELPVHAAVWAEGVPSETFVDDGSRGMFHNAASFRARYPDAADAPPVFCAPRVEGGPALDAIRRRLAATGTRQAA